MKQILPLLIAAFLLSACHGTQLISTDTATGSASAAHGKQTAKATDAQTYAKKVAAQTTGSDYLTSSVKVNLKSGSKDLSVNGRLQMKRDDCIRLSLRFLGIEVALFEFTPQDVLLVDRANKQYMRATYDEVSFLKSAGLDFYTLQSLFWDELFVPGQKSAAAAASRFKLKQTTAGPVLSLTDTPRLHYDFLTSEADATVRNVSVKSADTGQSGTFGCTYTAYTQFGRRQFPTGISISFDNGGKALALDLTLSSLKTDSDWNTRTTVSAKYTRRTVDQVLKSLK